MCRQYFSTARLSLLLFPLILMLALVVSSLLFNRALAATPEDEIGGTMRAVINGKAVEFPSLKSDVSANINGDLATVTVIQTFVNPGNSPLNATYLFPLNKDSAVYFMQMEVGDERITAVIKKKREARASFERAKREGKAAALLEQHRPNMFTQELANLMPGQPVKVTLKYSQVVPRIDGAYELVVPLVVGPRYTPEKEQIELIGMGQKDTPQPAEKNGEWNFGPPPAYPNVSGLDIPDTIDKERVSINVELQAAFPIKDVKSNTHSLKIDGDDLKKTATLASGRTIDNRDFVLRYQLAGKTTKAGVLVHRDQRGDFVSLMLEPPVAPADDDITPREMVFVLDTSGSMDGLPIEASKTFMRQALQSLRSRDYFRIIRFGNDASEFSEGPVPATMLNRLAGTKFVDSLQASGGTEVMSAVNQAFSVPQHPGTLRIVTFLSDGYIGNEGEILNAIAQNGNTARIYAFGVGTAVNRYFLAELARMGRGFARFIDPTEDGNTAAIELAKRLEAPLLTDISIDWGTLGTQNVTPAVIPDLFKGDSLRFMARTTKPLEPGSTHMVKVTGLVNGRKAALPLQVKIPYKLGDTTSESLPLIWARTQIADYMRDLSRPQEIRDSGLSNDQLREQVTKLGLDFSLMTQWTSFVAILEKVVNQHPADAVDKQVPLNQVKGVSKLAYGEKNETRPSIYRKAQLDPTAAQQNFAMTALNNPGGSFNSFSGGSTPEPGVYGGLIILSLMTLAGLWRRRKSRT